MESLKPSTRDLIQSFRLRAIPRRCKAVRNDVARWHKWCHKEGIGRRYDIDRQIGLLDYRRHLVECAKQDLNQYRNLTHTESVS